MDSKLESCGEEVVTKMCLQMLKQKEKVERTVGWVMYDCPTEFTNFGPCDKQRDCCNCCVVFFML